MKRDILMIISLFFIMSINWMSPVAGISDFFIPEASLVFDRLLFSHKYHDNIVLFFFLNFGFILWNRIFDGVSIFILFLWFCLVFFDKNFDASNFFLFIDDDYLLFGDRFEVYFNFFFLSHYQKKKFHQTTLKELNILKWI